MGLSLGLAGPGLEAGACTGEGAAPVFVYGCKAVLSELRAGCCLGAGPERWVELRGLLAQLGKQRRAPPEPVSGPVTVAALECNCRETEVGRADESRESDCLGQRNRLLKPLFGVVPAPVAQGEQAELEQCERPVIGR